jgi:hypothetical protein
MSARVASGHFYGGDCCFLVSGEPAQSGAERASQVTVPCAGPKSLDCGVAAATWEVWPADSAGKVPRADHRRHAVRLCRRSS